MDPSQEILDAFVDGEAVDPGALKQALSDPTGRDYLVDAWLLRGLVQDEIASDVAQALADSLSPPQRGRRVGGPGTSRGLRDLRAGGGMRGWLIAASVAGVCLVGGYFVGARYANVIVPRPATATAPPETATPPPPQSFPVPAATRVIRLEMDPNWKESSGGR